MSIIKAIRAQLGLSVTPANNFTLDASADNGTMKLARGNAGATTQDIFTVDAAGVLTASQGIVTNRFKWSTPQDTTSGTFKDFLDVPSWASKVTIVLGGVSGSGTSIPILQLGDADTLYNNGYSGSGSSVAVSNVCSSVAQTTGFGLDAASSATNIRSGLVTLVKGSGNTWVASGSMCRTDAAVNLSCSGIKTLLGVLTRIRLTTVNNTDTFDLGWVNALYEG